MTKVEENYKKIYHIKYKKRILFIVINSHFA